MDGPFLVALKIFHLYRNTDARPVKKLRRTTETVMCDRIVAKWVDISEEVERPVDRIGKVLRLDP
ncbi:hypothetical protein CA13_57830 [Planctomycetes bacterium CA13]|uniref:Uncharacterized protein n=1 Tax=Novipirellula herctigrandis TaxID=2527986 RepID=A0A5C5ZAY3_9BACT|nr:hypothetical protein CA13_57830 [Planctomycetes bacterium CA13]